jgi:hypothetical protein
MKFFLAMQIAMSSPTFLLGDAMRLGAPFSLQEPAFDKSFTREGQMVH